jgi:hypothetical protein
MKLCILLHGGYMWRLFVYRNPDVNKECLYYVTYRITAVIKVKVDIIDRLTASENTSIWEKIHGLLRPVYIVTANVHFVKKTLE